MFREAEITQGLTMMRFVQTLISGRIMEGTEDLASVGPVRIGHEERRKWHL